MSQKMDEFFRKCWDDREDETGTVYDFETGQPLEGYRADVLSSVTHNREAGLLLPVLRGELVERVEGWKSAISTRGIRRIQPNDSQVEEKRSGVVEWMRVGRSVRIAIEWKSIRWNTRLHIRGEPNLRVHRGRHGAVSGREKDGRVEQRPRAAPERPSILVLCYHQADVRVRRSVGRAIRYA